MTGNNFNNNFGNALDMASLLIGIINMYENRQQSAQNDVQAANDRQAQFLLQELNKKFEEQNQMLNQILTILKGENNEQR
jgi:hypothetical protein